MTTVSESRERAIRLEERALDSLRQQLAEARDEVHKLEDAWDDTYRRLQVLRNEIGEAYSHAVFQAELADHGCIACASARAGGTNGVMVHNGVGPDCPSGRVA